MRHSVLQSTETAKTKQNIALRTEVQKEKTDRTSGLKAIEWSIAGVGPSKKRMLVYMKASAKDIALSYFFLC